MNHPIQEFLKSESHGHPVGLPSLCSANEWVVDAGMRWAKKNNRPLLLEFTANQVNQFGGYTGMTPQKMIDYIHHRATENDFPVTSIFLGGDHLGPIAWQNENAGVAMAKAITLVSDFVTAGFSKIHLDASMLLADDKIEIFDTFTIAERAAQLAAACEQAFSALHENNPEAIRPIYVVGSEVPVAGGSHSTEESLSITTPESFHETVSYFKTAFFNKGLEDAWERVIAVVVQPGVEFGNDFIMDYSHEAATHLSHALRNYPQLVFEGHSTDYQNPDSLKNMVEDGIAILKVGPALTFALREGLYALQAIEKIIFADMPEKQSHYIETLEQVMRRNPKHWETYFEGSESTLSLNRIFGLSDRSRYYLGIPEVKTAENILLKNLSNIDIPLGLLRQFLPDQYKKIRLNTLNPEPGNLIIDKICTVLNDYLF